MINLNDLGANIRNWPLRWSALVLWVLILVAAVYGKAVTFSYLADDFFQFPLADTHGLVEIWQTAEGFLYYRPLAYTIWELPNLVMGYRSPAVLHLLSLVIFAANGLLVAWLSDHFFPSSPIQSFKTIWLGRYLAATLFLLFPFNYEAVSWIAAMMHLLVAFFILVALVSYIKWQETSKRTWMVFSLLTAFLAPFVHENGIFIIPLIIIIEMTKPTSERPFVQRLLRGLIYLIPTFLWWLIWRSVPSDLAPALLSQFKLAGLFRNVIYLMQAVAYPITWVGTKISEMFALNEFLVTIVLSIVAIALGAISQLKGRGRIWLFPWYWIVIGASTAVLFIPFRWFSASPRLLMVASVGIALFWADVLLCTAAWVQKKHYSQRLGFALSIFLALGLSLSGYIYIRKQTRFYDMASRVIQQTGDFTNDVTAESKPAIFINLPSWLSPPPTSYPLGEEGLLLFGNASELDGLAQLYIGPTAQIVPVRNDAILETVPYHFGTTGPGTDWERQAERGGEVFVTRYAPDRIWIEPAGAFPNQQLERDIAARFGETITLIAASATVSQERLLLTLTWQVQGEVPDDGTVFVHLLDETGQLIGQIDGDPLAGTFPFWLWSPGRMVVDYRLFNIDVPVRSLQVGVYRRSTGERFLGSSAVGEPLPDNGFVFSLEEE